MGKEGDKIFTREVVFERSEERENPLYSPVLLRFNASYIAQVFVEK